jgi:cytosine deaminase
MHSYNNAYAYKLIRLVHAAGLHFVTNPLDNSVLQGRFDGYPVRRGFTRVKELLRAGVNVAFGHDSIMDPWYPFGVGDPVQSCFVMVHYGHMSGHDELAQMLDFVTTRAAECLGLPDYGLAEGRRADMVVFDAPTPVDAVRTLAVRTAASRGRVVARTSPARDGDRGRGESLGGLPAVGAESRWSWPTSGRLTTSVRIGGAGSRLRLAAL